MTDSIKVYAPATVANVACGFDVLGFALYEPGDEIILRKTNAKSVRIKTITGDEGKLSLDVSRNTAGLVVQQYLEHIEAPQQGIEIELHKKMPLGSGLGSSAASAVAGLFAINALMGSPLNRNQLLPFAMEAERMACGAAHADNVAPALFGGFVLVRGYDPLDVVPISIPPDLIAIVIHPHIEIKTADARSILKKSILLKDAITQWGNIAGLIAGLMKPDYELIRRSLQDVIIEPVRSLLIPGFDALKKAAIDAGALGCSISGSGPSVFALTHRKEYAQNIAKAMEATLTQNQIGSDVYISPINLEGPRIIG